MPAEKFTEKANTPKKQRMWQHVYEKVRDKGGSTAKAVRQANAAVARACRKKRG